MKQIFFAIEIIIIRCIIIPVLMSAVYNNYLVLAFQLPTFSYWFFVLIMFIDFSFRFLKSLAKEASKITNS